MQGQPIRNYSKPPKHIKIRITHRAIKDGLISDIKTVAEIPLNVKLNDYIVRLGYSSSNLFGFIVELFTKGKVQLDFEAYTERLELVDPNDALTAAQAMSLLTDFIKEIETAGTSDILASQSKTTQRIMIKRPPSAS